MSDPSYFDTLARRFRFSRLGRLHYMGGVFGAGLICTLLFAALYGSGSAGSLGLRAYLLIIAAAAVVLELVYAFISARRLNDADLSALWVLLPLAGSVLVAVVACGLDTLKLLWDVMSTAEGESLARGQVNPFEALWAVMLNTTLINVAFSLFLCLREGSKGDNYYGPPPPTNTLLGSVLSSVFIACGSALNLGLVLLWITKQ
jgi:uncharacterized membrane protein YhaH (DUF805 family)